MKLFIACTIATICGLFINSIVVADDSISVQNWTCKWELEGSPPYDSLDRIIVDFSATGTPNSMGYTAVLYIDDEEVGGKLAAMDENGETGPMQFNITISGDDWEMGADYEARLELCLGPAPEEASQEWGISHEATFIPTASKSINEAQHDDGPPKKDTKTIECTIEGVPNKQYKVTGYSGGVYFDDDTVTMDGSGQKTAELDFETNGTTIPHVSSPGHYSITYKLERVTGYPVIVIVDSEYTPGNDLDHESGVGGG